MIKVENFEPNKVYFGSPDDIEDDYCCESVNWKDPSSIDTKLLLSSKTKEL